MTILIFIFILAVLIFVHELGHFAVAKLSGVRVDEFALGFPPKVFSFKYGETTYALNIIPFGGYVKIFGENPDEESISGPDKGRSLIGKPRHIQAAVLVAGVACNLLLAWLLFTTAFIVGFPFSADHVKDFTYAEKTVVISGVFPDSPASGVIVPGDTLMYVRNLSGDKITVRKPEEMTSVIDRIAPRPVKLGILSKGQEEIAEVSIKPSQNIIEGKWALGIGFEEVAVIKAPWYKAIWLGLTTTAETTTGMFFGLADLAQRVWQGTSVSELVVGPVGIAGMVGDARSLGLVYLITFTAFISVNLAVLNILPFPALDGGRLAVIFIESIIRMPISPKITNALNLAGFALLIAFMLFVTWGDVMRLF